MSFPILLNGHSPKKMVDRLSLPYGIWTCQDGREILFNREYQPIWQRHNDKLPMQADPKEWIQFSKSQKWFYDDLKPPMESPATRKKCLEIIETFCDGKSVEKYVIKAR